METIKERAYKHYPVEKQESDDIEESITYEALFDGYVKGAMEQRDIERKKFYKAYCSLCPCYMDGCAGECDKLKYLKHIVEHED